MKTRLILAFSILVVFGLSIAAFAYVNAASETNKASMSCCKGDSDSCPMKSKGNAGAEKASCCDMPDCCCKGDSCPMMNKSGDAGHEHSAGHDDKHESKGCCCKGDKEKSKDTV